MLQENECWVDVKQRMLENDGANCNAGSRVALLGCAEAGELEGVGEWGVLWLYYIVQRLHPSNCLSMGIEVFWKQSRRAQATRVSEAWLFQEVLLFSACLRIYFWERNHAHTNANAKLCKRLGKVYSMRLFPVAERCTGGQTPENNKRGRLLIL